MKNASPHTLQLRVLSFLSYSALTIIRMRFKGEALFYAPELCRGPSTVSAAEPLSSVAAYKEIGGAGGGGVFYSLISVYQ